MRCALCTATTETERFAAQAGWLNSDAAARSERYLSEAHKLAFRTPVPRDRRSRVGFGELVGLNYLRVRGSRFHEYQLLRNHDGREFVPGFDHIVLKYNGLAIDRALSAAGTNYHDPGLLDPWDLPEPCALVVIEAKITGRTGALRSYLPFNRRLGVRQMSLDWIAARSSSGPDSFLQELVAKHLVEGTVERFLVVRRPSEPTVRYFLDSDFKSSGIDEDRWDGLRR